MNGSQLKFQTHYRLHERMNQMVRTHGRGHTSWTAIAGFFDGDGSLDIDARAYTLHWVLSFSDNWIEQVDQVRGFSVRHNVKIGRPRRIGVGGWVCEVKEIALLKRIAKEMLRSGGIYKKRTELCLLLAYYSDGVTGTGVLEGFNTEVRRGIRVGKIRGADMPYTHSGGLAQARHASSFRQRRLNADETQNLIEEYLTSFKTGKSLARKYDVSEATVSRLLRRMGVENRSVSRIQAGTSDTIQRI